MPREPFAVGEGPLRIVPICHYRMEFAWAVRQAILAFRPRAVAVELPAALGPDFRRAVARLPRLTVLSYRLKGGEVMYLPVEPTDPLVEAVRTAEEVGLPVHFVDLAVRDYGEYRDPLPDSYALAATGLRAWWEAYERTAPPAADRADRRREAHMAALASGLAREGEVLLVCGISHVKGILEACSSGRGQVHRPAPFESVVLADPDLDSVREISAEPGLVNAAYEFLRGGPGPDGAWAPPPEPEEDEAPPRKPTALDALSGADAVRSLEALLGMAPGGLKVEELTPEMRRAVARYLMALREPGLKLPGQEEEGAPSLVGAPAAPSRPRIYKFRSVPDRRPDLRAFYARLVREAAGEDGMLDRQVLVARLLETAAAHYEENTGEAFRGWQKRTLRQFAGNYCRLVGGLLPNLYQCVVAARGVADDNYAYEVWDLGSFYPWTGGDDGLPEIRVRAGEVWLDGVKTMRFRRRLPQLRERLVRMPVRKRPEEENAGDWSREFRRGTICSYPPEDVVIEDFGRHLMKRALQVLSEERTRTEPFTASMLDGIDMRETLRNWHSERALYVREIQRVKGGAGGVVVIFDDDLEDRRFPWKMSWHGEHDQESDMAFYATPATAKVVGPGIARCEYGGLMLTYPPGRLLDVWGDPLYFEARTKAEVLLMAALDYSEEKHVVYVAARPPRSWFRTFAGRLGKKVVYLPLGQLSPVSLKKIRVFHVLSGKDVRRIARDYVW